MATVGTTNIFNFGNLLTGGAGSSFGLASGFGLPQIPSSDGTAFSPELLDEGGPASCLQGGQSPWSQGSPFGGASPFGSSGSPFGPWDPYGGRCGQQGGQQPGAFPGAYGSQEPAWAKRLEKELQQDGDQNGKQGKTHKSGKNHGQHHHRMPKGCNNGNSTSSKNPLAPQSLAGTDVWGDPHITSPNGNQQQFAQPDALLENANGGAVLVSSPGTNQAATGASYYAPGQDGSISTNPNQTEVYENLNGQLQALGTAQSLGIGQNTANTGTALTDTPMNIGANTSATFNNGTLNLASAF